MPKAKKASDYPVREPNADDALELFGILGAAGIDGTAGQSIGLAIAAYQSGDPGSQQIVVRAASEGIVSGLGAALRDKATREDARNFIYGIWQPKLSIEEGESYESKKREAWKKLPMRAPLEIVESFRKTENFADFLAFFTDMLPKNTSPEAQKESQEETNSGAS